MKKLITLSMVLLVVLAGCSTGRYASSNDFNNHGNRNNYNPGFYGPQAYNTGGFYNRGFYSPRYYGMPRGYYRGRPDYNQQRPPVIIRKTAPQKPLPPVKVKPINPRTDRVDKNSRMQ